MSVADIVLALRDFSYVYPETEKLVLREVSLEIPRGSFVGVTGANRAGKSTLCSALTGIIPFVLGGRYQGALTVNGVEISDENAASVTETVGIVFQDAESQFSQETVEDEIAFGMCNLGVPREEMKKRIGRVARECSLAGLLSRSPFALSGGQQQRVAVACMLALRPQVIILDETTSQLDPIGRQEVFRLARELHREGYTIVMVDHNIEKLAEYASRLMVVKDGGLALHGPAAEVLQKREELEAAGIRLPQVTRAAAELAPDRRGSWPVELGGAETFFREEARAHGGA